MPQAVTITPEERESIERVSLLTLFFKINTICTLLCFCSIFLLIVLNVTDVIGAVSTIFASFASIIFIKMVIGILVHWHLAFSKCNLGRHSWGAYEISYTTPPNPFHVLDFSCIYKRIGYLSDWCICNSKTWSFPTYFIKKLSYGLMAFWTTNQWSNLSPTFNSFIEPRTAGQEDFGIFFLKDK